MLAGAILIPPHPPLPPNNIVSVRGHQKVGKEKRGDVEMAKASLKCAESRDEPSTTLYLQFKQISYFKTPVCARC